MLLLVLIKLKPPSSFDMSTYCNVFAVPGLALGVHI